MDYELNFKDKEYQLPGNDLVFTLTKDDITIDPYGGFNQSIECRVYDKNGEFKGAYNRTGGLSVESEEDIFDVIRSTHRLYMLMQDYVD